MHIDERKTHAVCQLLTVPDGSLMSVSERLGKDE